MDIKIEEINPCIEDSDICFRIKNTNIINRGDSKEKYLFI